MSPLRDGVLAVGARQCSTLLLLIIWAANILNCQQKLYSYIFAFGIQSLLPVTQRKPLCQNPQNDEGGHY